jgi:hypothetical protein
VFVALPLFPFGKYAEWLLPITGTIDGMEIEKQNQAKNKVAVGEHNSMLFTTNDVLCKKG